MLATTCIVLVCVCLYACVAVHLLGACLKFSSKRGCCCSLQASQPKRVRTRMFICSTDCHQPFRCRARRSVSSLSVASFLAVGRCEQHDYALPHHFRSIYAPFTSFLPLLPFPFSFSSPFSSSSLLFFSLLSTCLFPYTFRL